MSHPEPATTMRILRFHRYGEPAEVLRLEEVPVPKGMIYPQSAPALRRVG